ncbi:MAG TPA: hypothetical protein DC032_09190 [Pseudomonas sp.]|nr:hypothetical protein [Pseudomonas sp.]
MTPKKDQLLLDEVAGNLGLERDDVAAVIDEFMLQLHRRIVEYDEPGNGNYIGERLWAELQPQAYFHFLGFLDRFSERYGWEPGTAHEYIARLFRPADWRPFSHQLSGWRESSHYRRGGSEQDESKDMK